MNQQIPDLPRVLVVMALQIESLGVFKTANVPVLYSGVGKVNAAIELTRQLSLYPHSGQPLPLVVNFGTAGSQHHSTGSMVACNEFVQRDMDASGLGFPPFETPYDSAPSRLHFDSMFAHLPSATCGSGDSFVTAAVACPGYTVIDMEAYALAKVCWFFGVEFGCVKYVTDGTDHDAATDWKCNAHKAAEMFLELYLKLEEKLKENL